MSNIGTATSGTVLQGAGAGAAPKFSTATYPVTAGTSGNVLTSDGTNWTSSAATGGGILVATTTLTSTQIKALHGTPIQLIAAPGANNTIFVIQAVAKYIYGGTNVFTAAASQTINLYYGTGANLGMIVFNASLTTAASSVTSFQFNQGGSPLATFENVAVNLYNSSATEITGNAANNNSVMVKVLYQIFNG